MFRPKWVSGAYSGVCPICTRRAGMSPTSRWLSFVSRSQDNVGYLKTLRFPRLFFSVTREVSLDNSTIFNCCVALTKANCLAGSVSWALRWRAPYQKFRDSAGSEFLSGVLTSVIKSFYWNPLYSRNIIRKISFNQYQSRPLQGDLASRKCKIKVTASFPASLQGKD